MHCRYVGFQPIHPRTALPIVADLTAATQLLALAEFDPFAIVGGAGWAKTDDPVTASNAAIATIIFSFISAPQFQT